MSCSKVKLAFFLFFIIGANIGFAQQPNLEFSTLNELESLSDIKATAIIQDANGYLWIGTQDGLFRFDGQTVYPYLHDENDKNSLPTNRITKLLLDAHNNLWVCSNEGLCRYNPDMDNFMPIVDESETRGVDGHFITTIAEDLSGQFYLATEKKIYKYDISKNLFSKVTEIKQGTVSAFVFDRQDNIWIAASTNGGLNYFDQKTQKLSLFRNDPSNKQSISVNDVFDIALVNENLWIATYGGGIDSYNIQDKTFKHYVSPYYYENLATSIFVDKKKKVWVCTLGALKLFNPTNNDFFNYYYDANNPKSLGKNIFRIYEDKQGNYWTAHTWGGVRVVRHKNKFEHLSRQPANFWTLSEKNTTSVSVDGMGHLWVGNFNNGIDEFIWNESKTEHYAHNDKNPNSLGNGTTLSIFRDAKKQMWVGSNLGGLQKFIPETKSFETYLNNPNDTLSIANNDIRSIAEDSGGNLWVAVHGKGVDLFDAKSKTFRHFNTKNSRLSNDYTFQVLNDSKGNLWVATVWGLSFLRKGEQVFKNFIYDKNDSTTVSGVDIHSLYEDANQNIWISTAAGLNKFDEATQSFKRYSAGLKNKNIIGIISDQKNNIWVSTSGGISKFDPNTLKFTNFDQSDGLLSKEYFSRACCKDDQNQLYFGGLEGVDYFNPDSLRIDTVAPIVALTDFKLFNKSISHKNNPEIIQSQIGSAKKIVLNYRNNSFTILFQAINLTNPGNISYAYKLNGFDRNWIFSQGKHEASYTNLNPGKYTFRVKASYSNGSWSEKETTIGLIIVPPWWMTTWFIILMGLVILTIPFAFVYWRTKRLNDQREKLEIIVAERTNEIQSKNELLKDLNSTKDKLFSIISHDLRSPFNAILGFQDLLLNSYSEFSDADRLSMIRQVHTTTNQTYYLVENLLNWARIQTNNIQPHPIRINLGKVILEKFDLYRDIAEAKGISFNHQLTDELFAFADNNLLETTLRNLINNAIKFTPSGGFILVKARKELNVITISVSDSGIGMTQEQIETLFNLEKTQSKDGTNGEKGSGLGLILCKEFVEKNNGFITVESQVGKGSTFSFTLPATPIV